MDTQDLLRGEELKATIRMDPSYFVFEHLSWMILGLLTLGLGPWLIWKYTVLYVTNLRVVLRTGVVSKQVYDMDIRKINQVLVKQSLGNRLLGLGYMQIIANDQGQLNFGPIAAPALVRKVIQEQVYRRASA